MPQATFEKEKRRRYQWIIRLIGILLFAYILLYRIDLSSLKSIFYQVRLFPLLFAVALAVPFILLKAVRWQILLQDLAIPLSRGRAFSLYAIGLFAGYVTPGQLGEFSKAIFLKKLGFTYDVSIISILFDRIFDLFILLLLALIGAMAFRELLLSQIAIFIFFFSAVFILLLLFASPSIRSYLYKTVGASLLPARLKEILRSSSLMQRVAKLSLARLTILKVGLMSLAAFSFAFFRYYLLILSLNISLPFWYFIGSVAIASVVSLLPISFAGIGTRDAVLIYLFKFFSLGQEVAISFSLLILLIAATNMVVGFICWLRLSL